MLKLFNLGGVERPEQAPCRCSRPPLSPDALIQQTVSTPALASQDGELPVGMARFDPALDGIEVDRQNSVTVAASRSLGCVRTDLPAHQNVPNARPICTPPSIRISVPLMKSAC